MSLRQRVERLEKASGSVGVMTTIVAATDEEARQAEAEMLADGRLAVPASLHILTGVPRSGEAIRVYRATTA